MKAFSDSYMTLKSEMIPTINPIAAVEQTNFRSVSWWVLPLIQYKYRVEMIIYALITHSNQLPLIILCEECFCRLVHKSTGVVFNSQFDFILITLFDNKPVKYKRKLFIMFAWKQSPHEDDSLREIRA